MTKPAGLISKGDSVTFLPFDVDLHEARRGDLVEEHPVGVQEKVMIGTGHPRRQVGEDEVIPFVVRDETVGRREVHALLPLFGGDLVAEARSRHDSVISS